MFCTYIPGIIHSSDGAARAALHSCIFTAKNVPQKGYHRRCTTEGVPQKGYHRRGMYHRRYHRRCTTEGVPQKVYHRRGMYHRRCTTEGVPQKVYRRTCTTEGVCTTEGAPQKVHHRRSTTEGVPQKVYHRRCTTEGVLPQYQTMPAYNIPSIIIYYRYCFTKNTAVLNTFPAVGLTTWNPPCLMSARQRNRRQLC